MTEIEQLEMAVLFLKVMLFVVCFYSAIGIYVAVVMRFPGKHLTTLTGPK